MDVKEIVVSFILCSLYNWLLYKASISDRLHNCGNKWYYRYAIIVKKHLCTLHYAVPLLFIKIVDKKGMHSGIINVSKLYKPLLFRIAL